MDTWKLQKQGYDPGDAVTDGNRFLCANGYLGIRGTLEEADKSRFPAVTLAGVYDRRLDRWLPSAGGPDPA